ncbi:CheR family methyltransferase [Clostridium beijerinckii]|uniref:CheR family methyltransferase n=1 Tax=Clostridium beijerinckii TaxID=1520 RepID=UPI00080A723D|nr:protein-glutamate O-methyltransferase CheR [Clostridium beijerinckii]OCA98023.1 hypothetical protein BGS1_03065 [Clostridium beijerinckii]
MDQGISKFLMIMNECCNKDVSAFDNEFLKKTLERRWKEIGCSTMDDYCSFIEQSITEAEMFYKCLYINFSQFFRDNLSFSILEHIVLPQIISQKSPGSKIRIWSAGCSYGQEPYSIAMLLKDYEYKMGVEVPFHIFATDFSEEALSLAKSGVYEESNVQKVSLMRLKRYFNTKNNKYIVNSEIKKNITFLNYDMLDSTTTYPAESIYGDFDVVLCCNMIIYYKPDVQKYIVKKLFSSLSDNGYLVTGEAEKILFANTSQMNMLDIQSSVFKYRRGR